MADTDGPCTRPFTVVNAHIFFSFIIPFYFFLSFFSFFLSLLFPKESLLCNLRSRTPPMAVTAAARTSPPASAAASKPLPPDLLLHLAPRPGSRHLPCCQDHLALTGPAVSSWTGWGWPAGRGGLPWRPPRRRRHLSSVAASLSWASGGGPSCRAETVGEERKRSAAHLFPAPGLAGQAQWRGARGHAGARQPRRCDDLGASSTRRRQGGRGVYASGGGGLYASLRGRQPRGCDADAQGNDASQRGGDDCTGRWRGARGWG